MEIIDVLLVKGQEYRGIIVDDFEKVIFVGSLHARSSKGHSISPLFKSDCGLFYKGSVHPHYFAGGRIEITFKLFGGTQSVATLIQWLTPKPEQITFETEL